MCERNGGVCAGISGTSAGEGGAGPNCPGGGDQPTGGESRPRGSLGSCYYISKELGPGKVGEGERNSLFAVGMRGGARWNVAVRHGATRGMFCANIVTLFLLWGLWER